MTTKTYVKEDEKTYRKIEIDKALRLADINRQIAELQAEKAELEAL